MTSKVNIKQTPTLLTKNLLAMGRVSPPNHHPSLHKKSFINQLGRVFPIYDFPQLEQKDKLLKVMPQLQLRRGDSGIRIKSVFTGRRLLVLSAPKVRKRGTCSTLACEDDTPEQTPPQTGPRFYTRQSATKSASNPQVASESGTSESEGSSR